ncbi:hypothetical protein [Amycolatopsis palatopharyngis]|uniref:hypothetical protein n=1 Tax=Amycolatopsis palatopharyngis TaxID=187982 RepID=UPI000E2365F2|nr:hypothetical protein [Amycolatopsis palatopharyngis]
MSIFGQPTDAERRRWQRRSLAAITELVTLGEERKLAPLSWTVPPGLGTVSGNVEARSHPRVSFEAWCSAIAAHPMTGPRTLGYRGNGATRDEQTNKSGRTRMCAAFEMRLPNQWGVAEVALIAEWFEDDMPTGKAL